MVKGESKLRFPKLRYIKTRKIVDFFVLMIKFYGFLVGDLVNKNIIEPFYKDSILMKNSTLNVIVF